MNVNSFVMMGPDCSSWGVPARGTSRRSLINPHGNVYLKWIRDSNRMISRKLAIIHMNQQLLVSSSVL